MDLVSVVTIRIRKGGKTFVVFSRDDVNKKGNAKISFPSGSFNESLNGNLTETVHRVLKKFVKMDKVECKIEYLGSYIKNAPKTIEVGYNYQINDFSGSPIVRDYDWIDDDVLAKHNESGLEVDDNVRIFLKVNKEFG